MIMEEGATPQPLQYMYMYTKHYDIVQAFSLQRVQLIQAYILYMFIRNHNQLIMVDIQ